MKRGFVLLETIAVLSIICVTLITLYGGYVRVIKNVQTRSFYDNTEYIYKTKIIANYLSNIITEETLATDDVYIYCNTTVYATDANPNPRLVTCNSAIDYSFLLNEMNVSGIYITKWSIRDIDSMSLLTVEPTTQKYIKQINDKRGTGYRIITMFKDRIDSKKYQYASIRFVPKS